MIKNIFEKGVTIVYGLGSWVICKCLLLDPKVLGAILLGAVIFFYCKITIVGDVLLGCFVAPFVWKVISRYLFIRSKAFSCFKFGGELALNTKLYNACKSDGDLDEIILNDIDPALALFRKKGIEKITLCTHSKYALALLSEVVDPQSAREFIRTSKKGDVVTFTGNRHEIKDLMVKNKGKRRNAQTAFFRLGKPSSLHGVKKVLHAAKKEPHYRFTLHIL